MTNELLIAVFYLQGVDCSQQLQRELFTRLEANAQHVQQMMTRLNPEDSALRMRAQQVFGTAALSASQGMVDVPANAEPEGMATSGPLPPAPGGSDEAVDTGLNVASSSLPNLPAAVVNTGASLQHLQSVSLDEVIANHDGKKCAEAVGEAGQQPVKQEAQP